MSGWLESLFVARVGPATVDPVEWELTARWADDNGCRIEMCARSVPTFEMPSLLRGLLEQLWGPLDVTAWINIHESGSSRS
jgi:hypothetical protein